MAKFHYTKPSKKLFSEGPSALSDPELLSLFMDEKTDKAQTALLFNFKSWRQLMLSSKEQFAILGIDEIALARVLAVKEIANRFYIEEMEQGDVLQDVQTTKKFLTQIHRDLDHEEFHVTLLDTRHRLIHHECMFKGTIDSSAVHPREVVKLCLKHNCAAVIFSHGHPSGDPSPSQADHRITDRLKEALNLIDVRTLDHFVIGETVVSFAERGYI